MSKEQNRFISAEKVILVTGIVLIVLAFISEFNFHYFQGFMPEAMDPDIFWRAEAAEVFIFKDLCLKQWIQIFFGERKLLKYLIP